MSEKLDQLKTMIADGRFHHATYRDHGTLWEGWKIYEKASDENGGFRGFKLALSFGKNDSEINEAYELIRNTGYSVGSYGNG